MRDGINVDQLVGLKRKDNEIRKSFDANVAIVLHKNMHREAVDAGSSRML